MLHIKMFKQYYKRVFHGTQDTYTLYYKYTVNFILPAPPMHPIHDNLDTDK